MSESNRPASNFVPVGLLGAYLALFVVCAIRPFDRAVWYAENIPIVLIVAFLVLTFRWFRFSNTAYLMMAVLVFLEMSRF